MNTTKAIVSFTHYTAADLWPVAQGIHDKLAANVAVFVLPTVPLVTLQAQITEYHTKLAARASQATAAVLALKAARAVLLKSLGKLGGYVNAVARGDAVVVELSGFPAYDVTGRSPDTSPPAAPADVRLSHGKVSGSVLARYQPQRVKSTNEVQLTTGDPNVEAGWHTLGFFQGSKAPLNDLTPGALIWLRVRTVGLRGVMGAWSDPAQIMVV